MKNLESRGPDMVIDVGKPIDLSGGLEFVELTYTVIKNMQDIDGTWVKQEADLLHEITGYAPKGCITAVMGPSGAGKSTLLDALAGRIVSDSFIGRVALDGMDVSPSLIKRTSAYIMQDDQLFSMLTVYETLMFAADFRLGGMSTIDKMQRVEDLIEQLGLSSTRNTYIGDEGTRGISGGERRRVSIGVDIIHGPPLLFLDEPTSGLDSTSAHSVIEKVHNIARLGSTVILTIHQPSTRIQLFLDHLIILARGQLMYQGPPKDVTLHMERMGRKVPKGVDSIEYFIDVVQEYDQSEFGVETLAQYALAGMKPPPLASDEEMSISRAMLASSMAPKHNNHHLIPKRHEDRLVKRLALQALQDGGFNHSVRSQWNTSNSWSISQPIPFMPIKKQADRKAPTRKSPSPIRYYTYSSDILQGMPTPCSSERTVHEEDYITHSSIHPSDTLAHHLGPKFANSFLLETWILIRRNFINIMRTPELFLSRLVVLTIMGVMMATLFKNPEDNLQGITNRISFFIFTVCLFFFSSNDVVPAFIQERFIFIRETSHNAYRALSYTIASLITYLPFLALQASVYAVIVWFPLKLHPSFGYFLLILFMSLLSTNSFVVFVSSVVPNYILGYAAVIAFTALFFLFCGYFLNNDAIPPYWKWMYHISTMTYPYEGLLMNQYQTNNTFGGVPGNTILSSLAIGTEETKKWQKVYWMLGWTVVYRILFYIILRFFSKNQRS